MVPISLSVSISFMLGRRHSLPLVCSPAQRWIAAGCVYTEGSWACSQVKPVPVSSTVAFRSPCPGVTQ